MARYFVDDPPVAVREFDPQTVVSEEGKAPLRPNVIWIRPRMDIATRGKVQNELFGIDNKESIEIRVGDNATALLIHNIVRWEGPDLDGVPCTRENICKLDPNEPHIKLVTEEIARRNRQPKSADPLDGSATTNGASSAGAVGSSTLWLIPSP